MSNKSKRELKLQAELKALVQRMLIDIYIPDRNLDRYERLLRTMYKLGIEPEVLLKKKDVRE